MPNKKSESKEIKSITQPEPEIKGDPKDIEANKTMAALSYIWILFLVPLLIRRNSDFVQFHAKQGLVLFICEVIIGLIIWIPLVGQVLALAAFIVAVIGIYKSLQGEYWRIPFLSQFAEKIKI